MTQITDNTSDQMVNVRPAGADLWAGVEMDTDTTGRTRSCAHCGLTFSAGLRGPARDFCSDRCKRAKAQGVSPSGFKQCAHCSNPFEWLHSEGRPRVHCSPGCRTLANRIASRLAAKQRQKSPNGKTCERCSKPLVGQLQDRFCSMDCARRGKSPPNKGTRIWGHKACAVCGLGFPVRDKGDPNKFCSQACYNSTRRKGKLLLNDRPKAPVACAECGSMFEPQMATSTYCGAKCRIKRSTRDQQMRKNPERYAPRECVTCKLVFTPAYGNWGKSCCSDACSILFHKKQRRHQGRIRKARRRAQLRGAHAESVDPFKVFARDKWHCQLCGRKTPKAARGLNLPHSPELDHIIPLSRGGPHTYANTQCACRECNGNKGATIAGQLNFTL